MLVGLLLTSGFVVRANAATEKEEDDNNFRESVFLCEEAVAHASACCGFKVQGDACRYYYYHATDDCGCSGGTDGSTTRQVTPVIAGSAAKQVIDTSCDELKAKPGGARSECERIYEVLQADNANDSYTASRCY